MVVGEVRAVARGQRESMSTDSVTNADHIVPVGPVGIEQPFVGFAEWPTMVNDLTSFRCTLMDDSATDQEVSEFEVLPHTTLWGAFRAKYWPGLEGARIWAESPRGVAGWKVTRLEFESPA